MNDDTRDRRLYNEKDVSRILKRATELHAASGTNEVHGLSLPELQQIAREAGIDPDAVAAAAAELDLGPTGRFHPLGGPLSIRLERTIEGHITEASWDAMLDEIRQTFAPVGVSSRAGPSLEWTYNGRREQAQVVVTERNGKVRMLVAQHYPRLAVLMVLPPLSLTAGLLPLILEAYAFSTAGWAAAIGLLGSILLVARFAFGSIARRRERRATELLRRLEQIVAASSTSPRSIAEPAATQAEEQAERAPLPDLPAPEPESTKPLRGQARTRS